MRLRLDSDSSVLLFNSLSVFLIFFQHVKYIIIYSRPIYITITIYELQSAINRISQQYLNSQQTLITLKPKS